ncbi:hypothetical protein AYJ54_36855 [Bradyrhizobium centrolobii]|uniref:Uncharacterized protein n=1 Tax=Bradyrhizobium centrolobii TaxID=1505087 RepID=A0A176Y6Y7_9BRAD|nr:hypothetical protein AYJ54_36855 [Bradyrhizobium centrolobii]
MKWIVAAVCASALVAGVVAAQALLKDESSPTRVGQDSEPMTPVRSSASCRNPRGRSRHHQCS